jgi:hypothetical protein
MLDGGILAATLATGCFGGGPGYSNDGYAYNSGYSGYGDSYPSGGYGSGYSYPQSYGTSYPRSYGNSYNSAYQSGVRVDENRDRGAARTETQHSTVNRESHPSSDSKAANSSERD